MMEGPFLDATGVKTLSVIAKADRFNQWMYETINPYLKGDVLELGSGIGNISKYLIKAGYNISLSDYDHTYCAYLKTHYQHFQNVKNILSIDLQSPEFHQQYSNLKEKFDTVYLLNVIEHLSDDDTAIKNCKYLLKQGGRLIILAPSYQWLYCRFDKELGHYRRYTNEKMRLLAKENQMPIIHSQYFNCLGIAGWLVFGKLLKKRMIGSEMSAFNSLVPFAKWIDVLVKHKIGLSTIIITEKR